MSTARSRPLVLQNYPSLHPVLDELLSDEFELTTSPSPDAESLITVGTGAVAIIARGPATLPRGVLERLDTVRFVVAPGSGTDNIDLDAATELGIAVVNNAGVAPQPVAEYVIGAIVAGLKRFREADLALRAGAGWDQRDWSLRGREAAHRTLGIIGYGHIGRDVARRARAGLDMNVVISDPVAAPADIERAGMTVVTLAELLERSDVITVHVPATPKTRHLIGRAEIAVMRPDALLINTSRGEVVHQAALTDALRAGRLGGAVLDVLDPEPADLSDPILDLPNVLATPHLAGMTDEGMDRLCRATAAKVLALSRGERPDRTVNDIEWPPGRAVALGWPLGKD
ncbi:hypothetical protein GIS00_01090 [Nakamurella sp. YIM 132087]|uniref:Hydroxyacid dehydrogenase n=1 Tax=Nakamurella alba TaxID=2665158 RepID=A0A7K1FGD0_9ACTN|nr:NAD(P)-dependent oxidoreductase [Nakamurella alba]MTD12539.1 hypothetical protein [Nakamurella alba]